MHGPPPSWDCTAATYSSIVPTPRRRHSARSHAWAGQRSGAFPHEGSRALVLVQPACDLPRLARAAQRGITAGQAVSRAYFLQLTLIAFAVSSCHRSTESPSGWAPAPVMAVIACNGILAYCLPEGLSARTRQPWGISMMRKSERICGCHRHRPPLQPSASTPQGPSQCGLHECRGAPRHTITITHQLCAPMCALPYL